jgi:hypothetical protein
VNFSGPPGFDLGFSVGWSYPYKQAGETQLGAAAPIMTLRLRARKIFNVRRTGAAIIERAFAEE